MHEFKDYGQGDEQAEEDKNFFARRACFDTASLGICSAWFTDDNTRAIAHGP